MLKWSNPLTTLIERGEITIQSFCLYECINWWKLEDGRDVIMLGWVCVKEKCYLVLYVHYSIKGNQQNQPPIKTGRTKYSRTLDTSMNVVNMSKIVQSSGPVFEEYVVRIRLSLTWGGAEVLFMTPIVQLLHKWGLSELFSVSPFRIPLVMAKEWETAFFWPIAFWIICAIHEGERD